MSQKSEVATQNPPQLETVEHVSATVNGQKKLLLALMAISAISLLSAVFAIVLAMGGSEHEALETAILPQDTLMRQQDARIEATSNQVEEVLALTEQVRAELAALSTQVAAIDVNDERNIIIRMQRLLIKQEQDFQAFISSLGDGMYNFHMMIPRSGGTWTEYKAELDAAAEKSLARESYANKLRDN